jgi:mycothiol system anti-sigma-R factor
MECREVRSRLSPFLDDELDPVASREISAHLESCPSCAAALDQQRKLGESLRRDLEYHRAPDLLRARILRDTRAAAAPEAARARPAARPWRWLSAAAAVFAVTGGTWWVATLQGDRADQLIGREAVSGHIRSLMATHLTDVTSTDQHTVKPWFAGKLDFSPPVTDFAESGYPLIGGRLDYLQGRPVAALVYLHRKHTINVFVWPEAGAHEAVAPAGTQQGFHVIHGAHAGMDYWLVSDLNANELAGFARMLVAPAPAPSAGSALVRP